jgi:hypothetical protein
MGQILAETIINGSHHAKLPDGVNHSRSSRAQKLAKIPDTAFGDYLATTMAAEKEITQVGALKLVATTPREDRRNNADAYSAPPIDVEIARMFGLEASDQRADLLVAAITRALGAMDNPRHAYVWARYHGIGDDGTIGESWTFAGIAATMGTSREYVETLYYKASHHVRGQIALMALNRIAVLMAAS